MLRALTAAADFVLSEWYRSHPLPTGARRQVARLLALALLGGTAWCVGVGSWRQLHGDIPSADPRVSLPPPP